MSITRIFASAACVLTLLAGCSSTPTKPPMTAQAPVAPTPATAKPAMPMPVKSMQVPAYLDPNSPISKQRSVYFDYDDYSVKKEFSGLIEMQGKYLAANPTVSIKVEGNADERGGTEYNLALGQKRAEAVLRALKLYGVKESQLEAISWGKEKPKATGHDEASWSQNRRVDLDYPKQ